MAAEVETMFYTREKPWHGLGTRVAFAPSSKEALIAAGLNWTVRQESVQTSNGVVIDGLRANVRDYDNAVLGVVGERYKVVQNVDAFAFTDSLLGKGIRYETAGSLKGGKRVWILAKLPEDYNIAGDRVEPYLVFSNSHDGSGAIKVAMTPIRVVCNNTLNLALDTASRSWSARHVGDIAGKLEDARATLNLAHSYMSALHNEAVALSNREITDLEVKQIIRQLMPIPDIASEKTEKTIKAQRKELFTRYDKAPDLIDMRRSAYRIVNAVSDYATHTNPVRRIRGFEENRFQHILDGASLLDKVYKIVA